MPHDQQFHGTLTVVDQVYYQSLNDQPSSSVSQFVRKTRSDEQPYGPRRITVGEGWVPLDTGWLGNRVSMVVVENLEGTRLQTIPTPEEAAETASRVVEVGHAGPAVLVDHALTPVYAADWLVHPGQSLRGCPATQLYVRCQHNSALVLVTAYPE